MTSLCGTIPLSETIPVSETFFGDFLSDSLFSIQQIDNP